MKNNQVGFRQALEFFRQTSKTVPAYKDFLKKNKINPNKIKNLEDFKKVPLVDKKNYLLKYPFVDLFPNRNIPPMVSASSGSSGQPFYWPRGKVQEVEGGQIHENIFRNIFEMPKKGTLMIVCFSMGSWVAGTYTLSSGRWISENSGGLTTITPGIDKDDVIGALKNFAPNFNQVILAGYPPFLMDVSRLKK